MATAGLCSHVLRKVMGKKMKKTSLSRLGCQQIQIQQPVLTPGQKLGTDHLKLREIHTTGLESLSCTSQVNHNKSLKRKGQTCEVLFVFTETSSPTYPQPNQQRNQLPLVRPKPDPRNERRTWPPGKRKPRMNHFLLQWRVNRPDPLLSPFKKRSILLFSTLTLPFIGDGQ